MWCLILFRFKLKIGVWRARFQQNKSFSQITQTFSNAELHHIIMYENLYKIPFTKQKTIAFLFGNLRENCICFIVARKIERLLTKTLFPRIRLLNFYNLISSFKSCSFNLNTHQSTV